MMDDHQGDTIVCKICSQSISDNNFVSKSKATDMLNGLFLDLNYAFTKDLIICTQCSIKLKNCFDFKMECSKTDSILSSSVKCYKEKIKLDLIDVCMEQNKDVILDGNAKNKRVCRFCLKLSQNGCIVNLYETKENMSIVDMLAKHIPKMKLSLTEELMTCDACLNLLKTMYDINESLKVDSRINHHLKLQAADENHIQTNNVQKVKPELNNDISCSDLKEERNGSYILNGVFETEVKVENFIEEDIEIKHEEIDIKLESNHYDSLSTNPNSQLLKPTYKCHLCPYKYKQEQTRLKHHMLKHKHPSEVQKYKCDLCPYWSIIQDELIQHKLIHTKLLAANMYKCELCPFKTKVKIDLYQHMNIHNVSEILPVYKCKICLYQTKVERCLQIHMLKHKDPSEVVMYKCNICPYKTMHKVYLRNHTLVHKSPAELHMYKCNLCAYAAKRKYSLVEHQVRHKDPSEVTMHQCKLCSYQTKSKGCLRKHSMVHKSNEQAETYICDQCSYTTKQKRDLAFHMRTHKGSSKFSCGKCAYNTNSKSSYMRHRKTHGKNSLNSRIAS